MAEIEIILQGLCKNDDHSTAINRLLQLEEIENYLFSLAFVRESGIIEIKYHLQQVAEQTTMFVGVRNGIRC